MNPQSNNIAPRSIPILFDSLSVRSIVDGRKTQTRRTVKWPKPRPGVEPHDLTAVASFRTTPRAEIITRSWDTIVCPYAVGDRLWVRETFAVEHSVESNQPLPFADGRPTLRRAAEAEFDDPAPAWRQAHYRATDPAPALDYDDGRDEPHVRWTASIHMPRTWSRLTLEVTAVRVELLNAITEADCLAEGIAPFHGDFTFNGGLHLSDTATNAFAAHWRAVYGHQAWDDNPSWLWVIDFQRITAETA